MKYSLLTPMLSLMGGGTAAVAAAKKGLIGQVAPKRYRMVVPYGHVAYKTMFGNPVYRRFGKRKGQVVERRPKQLRRIPFLQRLACIDVRPQRHEMPPQQVTFRDGVSFNLLPVLTYQVVYGFSTLFDVEEWHRYLIEGCQIVITEASGNMTHREFLDSNTLIAEMTSRAQEKAEVCGILIEQLAFKDKNPSSRSEAVITQEALGLASAKGLNAFEEELTVNAAQINPLLPAAMLGGMMMAGGFDRMTGGISQQPSVTGGTPAEVHVLHPTAAAEA